MVSDIDAFNLIANSVWRKRRTVGTIRPNRHLKKIRPVSFGAFNVPNLNLSNSAHVQILRDFFGHAGSPSAGIDQRCAFSEIQRNSVRLALNGAKWFEMPDPYFDQDTVIFVQLTR